MKGKTITKKRNCQWECKELDDWGSCKNDYMWNPSMCDYECHKAWNIYEYLNTKNCSWAKNLICKLVLALPFEDEILNTSETLVFDNKRV